MFGVWFSDSDKPIIMEKLYNKAIIIAIDNDDPNVILFNMYYSLELGYPVFVKGTMMDHDIIDDINKYVVYASKRGKLEMVDTLINKNMHPTRQRTSIELAYNTAARFGHIHIIEYYHDRVHSLQCRLQSLLCAYDNKHANVIKYIMLNTDQFNIPMVTAQGVTNKLENMWNYIVECFIKDVEYMHKRMPIFLPMDILDLTFCYLIEQPKRPEIVYIEEKTND